MILLFNAKSLTVGNLQIFTRANAALPANTVSVPYLTIITNIRHTC
jgi:hypothetical protein